MEVLTVIVAALAFAGGEAAKTVVAEGVKDAYRKSLSRANTHRSI
jgi:hypothetical protein